VTLKSWLEVTQDQLKWYHSKAWCSLLFAFHSNYMALSCISSEINTDIGRKSWFFVPPPPLQSAPRLGGPRRNIAVLFGMEKLKWLGYPTVKHFEDMYNRLYTISACDGQTDRQTNRQTSFHSIVRAMHTRRAVKTGTSPYYWPYLTGVISVAISTGMVFPCIHCYDVVDHDFM